MPIRFDGADLSHHQDDAGKIDWPALRQASWWVATKATQGLNYVDPTFTAHRAQMGVQGFTHRLFYGWLSAHVDPVAQARHFLDTVIPLVPPEGCMIDAEEGGITAADVVAWCRTVEAVTHRPVAVYSGAYTAGGTIWQSIDVHRSDYGPRPMHLAAYTTEAKAKALPGVKANPWQAWQYSSDGPVPGVVGRCDMNRIDDIAAYDLACGVATPNPQPLPEDDMIDIVRDAETSLDKFAVMPDGTLRPLSGTELKARKIANAVELGEPLTKAERDLLGTYMPAGVNPAALNALNDAVGRLGQNQEGAAHELDQVAAALRGDGH